MNRFLKTAILSVGLAATTVATFSAANADDWGRPYYHNYHHRNHGGDALAAGVVGLAAGALIGSALSNPGPRYYEPAYGDDYYDRPVRRYYVQQPRVVYADRYAEPWTRGWYEYCSDRYRTFNSRTGTFTGNDGAQHFCVAN